MMKQIQLGLLICILFLQSGCSLFFGNIRPIEEKSQSYGIVDLSKSNPSWQKVSPHSNQPEESKDVPESGISDITYQSQVTASIISINSACRKNRESTQEKNLKELTRELLLGISDITFQDDTTIKVDKAQALQTTLEGQMNHELVKIRAVVLQKNNCVYDLMFIARPGNFNHDESDFKNFVSSLKLK